MKTKYFKYVYILLITLILFIAGSYAYFSWGSDTNSNTNVSFDVVAESVYIEYDAGSDITGANLYPVDDKSNGISKTITVKTDKVSSKPVTFNLYLDLTSVPTALLHSSFKWAVYTGNNLVSSGNLTDSAVSCNKNSSVNHIVLFSNEKVTTTEKKYVLYLWIDGTGTDNNPDDMMNKSFEFNLHADGDNALLKNLFNVMEKQAILDNKQSRYVSSSSGIDFSQISSDTNGKGVYIKSGTENDTYPIYYYRGAVDNNNVIFANFCWKIVRTTETGGTKLIYNGVPSNGTCNNTGSATSIGTSAFNTKYDSPVYVGYMYGSVDSTTYDDAYKNTNSSTIKNYIDNWYKSNMLQYSKKLEDTVWCNDRKIYSGSGIGSADTIYLPTIRLVENKEPSLICDQINDRFSADSSVGNGALTYPVGLLTADEVAFAGGVFNLENSNYYLYSGSSFWLGSSVQFLSSYAFVVTLNNDGAGGGDNVSSANGIRPSVSLAYSTTFSSGDGTANSPYVIE